MSSTVWPKYDVLSPTSACIPSFRGRRREALFSICYEVGRREDQLVDCSSDYHLPPLDIGRADTPEECDIVL
eukprot:1395170-Amorphochlora_amoeboformis.AAC.1